MYIVFRFDAVSNEPLGTYFEPEWALALLDETAPCPMCAWRAALREERSE
jgi:hypothetical protein